jgi:hypothetical protein
MLPKRRDPKAVKQWEVDNIDIAKEMTRLVSMTIPQGQPEIALGLPAKPPGMRYYIDHVNIYADVPSVVVVRLRPGIKDDCDVEPAWLLGLMTHMKEVKDEARVQAATHSDDPAGVLREAGSEVPQAEAARPVAGPAVEGQPGKVGVERRGRGNPVRDEYPRPGTESRERAKGGGDDD